MLIDFRKDRTVIPAIKINYYVLKFGVNVVVILVDNMPLVFFYFSPKPFKKKILAQLIL